MKLPHIVFSCLIILLPFAGIAQVQPPPPTLPQDPVPIDDFLIYLLLAGILLGYTVMNKKNTKRHC